MRLHDITKSYDGGAHNVLDKLELTLENGERLVVAGRNGAGKSTLLRIIAGEDSAFTGEVVPGAGVSIGYFSQDNAETIKGKETILDYLEARAPLELIPKLRDMLGAFLFRGDDVYKSLDVLSGGEKSRIALLQLLLSPVNLLVLDEPTNHLDIHSKDVLLQALRGFGGTVIFVSHDRGFIEQLATKVLHLEHGTYKYFVGGYEFYMEQMEKAQENDVGGGLPLAPAGKPSSATPSAGSDAARNACSAGSQAGTQLSWEEQKKLEAARRKAEKEIANLEAKITELEAKKSELENKLADPAVYSNGEKAKAVQRDIEAVAKEIDETTAAWEAAAEKMM